MIEQRLDHTLINQGYIRMDSNSPGVYAYYCMRGDLEAGELSMISVIHVNSTEELDRDQYKKILETMKGSISYPYPFKTQLLSLIMTVYPERVKHLCVEWPQDNHWIIDQETCHLMIYENPYENSSRSNDVIELQKMIEQLLEDEFLDRQKLGNTGAVYHNNKGFDLVKQKRPQKYNKYVTPVNTTIILLNILVYFLTYYSPVFGDSKRTVMAGALSWYNVINKGEFYRLLTSMFLHADFGHLFNNMLVLLFVGDNLERAVGKYKYLIIYMGGGILAGITSIGYNMWKYYEQLSGGLTISIGASGAIFGVVGAMLLIVIINRGGLEDISAARIICFVVFSLYGGIVNARIDQAAHVGGFLVGLVLAALICRKPTKEYIRRRD